MGAMKTLILTILVLFSSVAYAQQPCPKCGKVHQKQTNSAQAHAQREAEMMARTGRVRHYLGVAPGCRFSGVGFSSHSRNPPTCVPWRYGSSARILVADAIVCNGRGCYRSRHWR